MVNKRETESSHHGETHIAWAGHGSVAELLPGTHEALGSNLSTRK